MDVNAPCDLSKNILGDRCGGGALIHFGAVKLVAELSDPSYAREWGPVPDTVGASSDNNGLLNIAAMLAHAGSLSNYPDPKYCDDSLVGGYSDWYMPAKNELNAIYVDRAYVGGSFNSQKYMSSTEYSGYPSWMIWSQNMNTGLQDYEDNKHYNTRMTRCIRYLG